jgi:hypothetical protein
MPLLPPERENFFPAQLDIAEDLSKNEHRTDEGSSFVLLDDTIEFSHVGLLAA